MPTPAEVAKATCAFCAGAVTDDDFCYGCQHYCSQGTIPIGDNG